MITFGLFTSVNGHEEAEKELNEKFEMLIAIANESPAEGNSRAIAVRELMRATMNAERFCGYGASDTVCDENLVLAINEQLNVNIKRWE